VSVAQRHRRSPRRTRDRESVRGDLDEYVGWEGEGVVEERVQPLEDVVEWFLSSEAG
jgi:hypothetical protein